MPLNTNRASPRTHEDRPTSSTPSSATNTDTLVDGYLTLSRKLVWSAIVPVCPFCTKRHIHGAPEASSERFLSRQSHCLDGGKPYLIVIESEATAR